MGEIWARRSITLRGPKSGEHDDQMAPRLAVASSPTKASGMFGVYAATRSPLVTPRACNPVRTLATSPASSPKLSVPLRPDSDRKITAVLSGCVRAVRSALRA